MHDKLTIVVKRTLGSHSAAAAAVAAATRQIIVPHTTHQILDLFGLSKFKWGQCPLAPLKKIYLWNPPSKKICKKICTHSQTHPQEEF